MCKFSLKKRRKMESVLLSNIINRNLLAKLVFSLYGHGLNHFSFVDLSQDVR